MTCPDHDADLLAWVHGDLDRAQRWRLRAHLTLCPRCRDRVRRYASLTRTLSRAYRNPTLGIRAFPPIPRRAWAPLGALVIVLSIFGWLSATDVSAETSSQTSTTLHVCHERTLAKPNFPAKHCDP